MAIPNIDTFEHDISEEIKTKEATIGDIASAGGEVGNASIKNTSLPTVVAALGVLFSVAVIAIGAVMYIKYTNESKMATAAQNQATATHPQLTMDSISPTIAHAVGDSIKSVQRSEFGYTVELLSYSPVFAYMVKNESQYADEIAGAVGSARDTSTTTPNFVFSDTTIDNQNMRVGTSGSSTVVYAFVNTNHLLISDTTDSILKLRSAILH